LVFIDSYVKTQSGNTEWEKPASTRRCDNCIYEWAGRGSGRAINCGIGEITFEFFGLKLAAPSPAQRRCEYIDMRSAQLQGGLHVMPDMPGDRTSSGGGPPSHGQEQPRAHPIGPLLSSNARKVTICGQRARMMGDWFDASEDE
jgi:hypothetical protein